MRRVYAPERSVGEVRIATPRHLAESQCGDDDYDDVETDEGHLCTWKIWKAKAFLCS